MRLPWPLLLLLVGCGPRVTVHRLSDYAASGPVEPRAAPTLAAEREAARKRDGHAEEHTCRTPGREIRWITERLGVTEVREAAYDAESGELLFVDEHFTPDVWLLCCIPPGESDQFGVMPRCNARPLLVPLPSTNTSP